MIGRCTRVQSRAIEVWYKAKARLTTIEQQSKPGFLDVTFRQ